MKGILLQTRYLIIGCRITTASPISQYFTGQMRNHVYLKRFYANVISLIKYMVDCHFTNERKSKISSPISDRLSIRKMMNHLNESSIIRPEVSEPPHLTNSKMLPELQVAASGKLPPIPKECY